MKTGLPMKMPNEIPGFLRHIRETRCLTQSAFARQLQVDRQYIWNAENLDSYAKGLRGMALLKRVSKRMELDMREREHMKLLILDRIAP